MSVLSVQGEQSSSAEIDALNNLASLAGGTGLFIRKTGATTFENASEVGMGTVTKVSVVSANGLAGTVATDTTTPAITISTSITGLLKGNGTAISAASDGTDFLSSTTGLKLDQTTPQTLINGIPLLEEARVIDGMHELVDKAYVDLAVTALGQHFYMLSTGSGVTQPVTSEEYYNTSITPSAGAETSITSTDPADDAFIAGWISPVGSSFTKLIAGVYEWHIFTEKTGAGNKLFRVYWTLVERKSDDSEVLIATSAESNVIGVKADNAVTLVLSSDYTPSAGSKIIGKIYASLVSGVSASNIVLYSEGTSDSHWEIPTNKEILDTLYQPLDADLTTIAGLSSADGNFIVGSATGWVAESGATARTSLGLGTIATAASGDYALVGQTFYIGTTQVAINRASAALTLAGLTLTTPDIGTPSAGVLTNCSGYPINIVDDTTPELGGEMDAGAHSIGFTQQSFTGDGTTTIDWKLGNKAYFTFGNANETFTFTAPSNPCNLVLVLKQYSTGGKTATWPNTVMWPGGTAPTLSTGNNAIDIISFYYDGTNYYGVSSLNFSVPA